MATQTYTNGVTLSDAGEWNRWDTAAYPVLTGVAGTNTVTATGPANYALSATMPPLVLIPANTNTGAVTLAVTPSGSSALTAKSIFIGGVALSGGELIASVPVVVAYDGTQFNILGKPAPILRTEQASTSGTALDFTGIPSWVTTIVVQVAGISTNGTSNLRVQLGDSGGVETSGYAGGFDNRAAASAGNFSAGFDVFSPLTSAGSYSGTVTLTKESVASNRWLCSFVIAREDNTGISYGAGSKATSATTDRVRITTSGGDTFDAGVVNLLCS